MCTSISFIYLAFFIVLTTITLVGVDGARDEKLPPILHETNEKDNVLGL